MTDKPRDVLAYTGKLPRYEGAADAAPLLLPAWVRAGQAAFAISIDQLAGLVGGAMPPAPTPAGLVPAGGAAGQVLAKSTDADYALSWTTVRSLPMGGVAGQVLTKVTGLDGDAQWATPSGGGGGNNYFPGGWA